MSTHIDLFETTNTAGAIVTKDLVVMELSKKASSLLNTQVGRHLFPDKSFGFCDQDYRPIDLIYQLEQAAQQHQNIKIEVGISTPEKTISWWKVELYTENGHFVVMLHNIDELIAARRLNSQLSICDPHTGLLYRSAFLSKIKRMDKSGTMCCIRICNYTRIGEIWGTGVANLVFMEILARVQQTLPECLCAKHSNDSFNLFVPKAIHLDIQKLYQELNDPFQFNGHSFYSNVALGYYVEQDNDDPEQSLNKAEIATLDVFIDRVKLVEFQEHLAQQLEHQNYLETELHSAITYSKIESQFHIVFQPLHDAQSEKLVGAECLCRWILDGKIVSPVEFIPIAEKLGEIGELTKLAIKYIANINTMLAAEQLDAQSLIFAINISVVEILDVNFVDDLIALLKQHSLSPQQVKLELTESALIDNFNYVNDILKKLQQHGFKISIDDFGTGFSSLSYLCRLSFDEIKIDRSFVTHVDHDEKLQTVFNSIASLAQNLEKPVVAEGVEELPQLAYAQQKQIKYIQGYYFSKPLKIKEYVEYAKQHL